MTTPNHLKGCAEVHDYSCFDLMPAYWRFLKAGDGVSHEEVGKCFDSIVISPKREIFGAVALGWTFPENVASLAEAAQGRQADFRLVESKYPRRFEGAWQQITAHFEE